MRIQTFLQSHIMHRQLRQLPTAVRGLEALEEAQHQFTKHSHPCLQRVTPAAQEPADRLAASLPISPRPDFQYENFHEVAVCFLPPD